MMTTVPPIDGLEYIFAHSMQCPSSDSTESSPFDTPASSSFGATRPSAFRSRTCTHASPPMRRLRVKGRQRILTCLQLAVLGLNLCTLHAYLAFASHWDTKQQGHHYVHQDQFNVIACIVAPAEAFSTYKALSLIRAKQNARSLMLSGLIGLTPVHLVALAGGLPNWRSALFCVFWSFWSFVLVEEMFGLCGRAVDAYVRGTRAPKDPQAQASRRHQRNGHPLHVALAPPLVFAIPLWFGITAIFEYAVRAFC